MRVKAKWNVKGSDGWHLTGEIFETKEDFGNAVEVLDAPKRASKREATPVKAPEPETEKPAVTEETTAEPLVEEEPKPRTPSRRKISM